MTDIIFTSGERYAIIIMGHTTKGGDKMTKNIIQLLAAVSLFAGLTACEETETISPV
jgi:hypothetical protein